MNQLIKQVLLANASQLGFNWIYNQKFLKEYSKENEMLMTAPNNEHYHHNKPSYNTYEGKPAGSNTLQGEIVKWLYNDVVNHGEYTSSHYKTLLLRKLTTGGEYSGYVESYGKKLVYNQLDFSLKLNNPLIMDDDQLVGFVPYIVYKALNKNTNEAFKLTEVLTNNQDYSGFFKAFDDILEHKKANKKEAIINSLKYVPEGYHQNIKKALMTNNSEDFISGPHDLSCSIDVALPIIYYLFNKHESLFDALQENVILGGASGDRALLLGLLYFEDELPKKWDKYLKEI